MLSSNIFYDRFSEQYDSYSKTRQQYIESINTFILQTKVKPKNILDLGAGTGSRTRNIATKMNIREVVLVDNSPYMLEQLDSNNNFKTIIADISGKKFIDGKFDLILCLWNVLGHVTTHAKRVSVMSHISELLDNDGYAFIDVNNRYNVSQYGLKNVFKNFLKDVFIKKDTNGDFPLSIKHEESKLETMVHIFNPFELDSIIRDSNLVIVEKKYVNYATGRISNNPLDGQILYKIKKS